MNLLFLLLYLWQWYMSKTYMWGSNHFMHSSAFLTWFDSTFPTCHCMIFSEQLFQQVLHCSAPLFVSSCAIFEMYCIVLGWHFIFHSYFNSNIVTDSRSVSIYSFLVFWDLGVVCYLLLEVLIQQTKLAQTATLQNSTAITQVAKQCWCTPNNRLWRWGASLLLFKGQ